MTVSAVWGNFFYDFFNTRGLLFFCIGMALSAWKFPKAHVLYVVMAFAVLKLVEPYSSGVPVLNDVVRLGVPLCLSCCVYSLVPACELPKWIVGASFSIFGLHELIFFGWRMALGRLAFLSWPALDALLPFLSAVSMAIAVHSMTANMPKARRILFGGR